MRAAPSIRADGVTDGWGSKLVWSPLSNLVLYGETTYVYDASAAGVLVSLGTDWTPSGSRSLLHELKIADVALRDPRILGGACGQVPGFGGQHGDDAPDQAPADMVTRNPALALRWDDKVGSIEPGKVADLLLLRRSAPSPADPRSVYRELIDATDANVELVLVGGQPRAGDVDLMTALRPSTCEIVTSPVSGFSKAVDVVTTPAGAETGESLAAITARLQAAVYALGGDNPPAQGGPGPAGNTYSYLKAHVAGGAAAGLPDAVFRELLAANVGMLPDGSLNIERLRLNPLLEDDDSFLALVLSAVIDPATGLIRDPDPAYHLYPAHLSWIGPAGNPFQGLPG
jgi:Amidohydrolase family